MTADKLHRIVLESLELDQSNPPRPINDSDELEKDLGMESLYAMSLVSAIEEEYSIELDLNQWQSIKTVRDLRIAIIRRLVRTYKFNPPLESQQHENARS